MASFKRPATRHGSVDASPLFRQRRRSALRKWDRRIALLLALGTGSLFLPVRAPHTIERARVPLGADTVEITAGPSYRAGPLHRFLFGRDYRSLWTQPIRVPLLDLDHVAGGLKPLWIGGGMQTRALRLASADGRQYVFRSIDKDPTPVLRSILHRTLINDAVQDQVSAELPAAALIVAPLLRAAGVRHATPVLVVLPDDSRLGEFRGAFAGMLGTLEESPPDPGLAPRVADTIVDTEGLIARQISGSGDHVDARAFLTARLMDLWLNDWDRHEGQWRWVIRTGSVDTVWLPVPRDRDQAFVTYDGLMLTVMRRLYPKLVRFGPAYPDFTGLLINSREIDQRFLSQLSRGVWDSIASVLVSRLPDSVIDAAVHQMPVEYYRLAGPALASILQRRRDRLPDIASRFYRILARTVEVHPDRRATLIEITRRTDGVVRVRLRPQGGAESQAITERIFHPDETKEIRIFPRKGDRVTSSGAARSAIRLRLIDSEGHDVPADSAVMRGVWQ
jgi:hypothetical protein